MSVSPVAAKGWNEFLPTGKAGSFGSLRINLACADVLILEYLWFIPRMGAMMSMKCISVYLHLVWATWDRKMWIDSTIERRTHRMIISAAKNLGCSTLAINGMPDHVHLLVKLTSTITIAELVKRAKGTSSRLINQYFHIDDHFQWGVGYGAFSVSRWDTDKVVNYIKRQKEHHQSGYLIEDLESLPYTNA